MTPSTLSISAVLSGLSAALDITEGHPRGHAERVYQMFGGPDEHETKRALEMTTQRRGRWFDVADALMSARPYREAMPIDQVLALVQEGRDTQFCPDCVDALDVSLKSVAA